MEEMDIYPLVKLVDTISEDGDGFIITMDADYIVESIADTFIDEINIIMRKTRSEVERNTV